jgi:hypothetical protein
MHMPEQLNIFFSVKWEFEVDYVCKKRQSWLETLPPVYNFFYEANVKSNNID